MYDCPDRVPVFYEPLHGAPQPTRPGTAVERPRQKPSAEQVRRTILVRRLAGLDRRAQVELLLRELKHAIRNQERLRAQTQQMRRESSDIAMDQVKVADWFGVDPLERMQREVVLTNPDEGLDPDIPTTFDNIRIDDVSVPGPVDPNQVIVIRGASDVPPLLIPPPGTGSRVMGQVDWNSFGFRWASTNGRDIDGDGLLDVEATGLMGRDLIEGFRGLRNVPGGFAGRSGATREKTAMEGGGHGLARDFYGFDLDGRLDFRDLVILSDGETNDRLNVSVWDTSPIKQTSEAHAEEIRGRLFSYSVMYHRPALGMGQVIFRDLTLHAPGLNTMDADVRAVLEAEAEPSLTLRVSVGHIAEKARALVEKARRTGWQKVSIPAGTYHEGYSIVFDGAGRYRCERVLPLGLREIIVCDGKTLWHLYPDIGLGARRTVSRFHRADFSSLVPAALPPVEELAHGADVEAVGEDTVAVVPHQGRHVVHLVFAQDGRLVERKLIEKKGDKVVRTRKSEASPAEGPELTPDVKALVVLPMPLRTREHLEATYPGIQNKLAKELKEDEALALLAAQFADHSGNLQTLIK
jgi:hypothetical protein